MRRGTGRSWQPWALILTLWLGIAWIAHAVIWHPLSIADLTRKADCVIQAKVVRKQALLDEANAIYTRIELQLLEVWKGQVQDNPLIIVQGGGRVGNRETLVSGQAIYQVGEEVVAFLVRNTRGQAVTIGLAQGKFQVTRDPGASEPTVHNLFHGRPPTASDQTSRARPNNQARLTLADLKRQVQGGAQ